jgi:membrane-associated protease RseP (regulator of RpoE activity)
MHLILGIFNLLPMKSLDGGQFVLMVMQNLFGVKKGIFVSNIIFVITEVLLVTAGVYLFFKTRNFTLILTVMHLLFLSIFAK